MKSIKLFDPDVSYDEEKAMQKVLYSKFWASGSGIENVKKFEDGFKKYIGSENAISVNSGTAALHLACKLFTKKNSEVILPSLSFVASAHSIIMNNAKPIFCDIEEETLCIDPERIKESINDKTSAIMPVHFGGMSCNLEKILKISAKYKKFVIEDAAHATGTRFQGKKIGNHGDAVCFSFHPVKNLAMPNGGLIILNNKKNNLIEKLKSMRWCGITNRKNLEYDVKQIGWNYYMNEFSAAIGLAQLKKIEKMNNTRKNIARRYFNEIKLINKMPFSNECSYHLYWIRVKDRKNCINKFHENKIEVGIHYKPIHKMSMYKSKLKLPVTEKISKEILSIPVHQNLKENDVDRIIKIINKFC